MSMNNAAKKAVKSSQSAEKDLVQAKDWVKNGATVQSRREGRRMARAAKRRRSKAERRIARSECSE